MGDKWCRWFGHKWIPVYIGKRGQWKIIGAYCQRCRYGRKELIKYLNFLDYGKGYDFGTYNERYFQEAE